MTSGAHTAAADLADWLLFAHIVAAMVWVGGVLLLNVLAIQALRARDPDAVARLLGTLRVIGPRVFAPAVVLLAAFGVWLVLDTHAWAFGQTWIQVGIALFAAVFLVGILVMARAAAGAERAVAQGDRDRASRLVRRLIWGYELILVLLVVATWDMVVKPGL